MFFEEKVNENISVEGFAINNLVDYNNFLIESEESWWNLQVAAMAASHKAIIEDNQSLMEGVVRDYWEKAKEFFQKLWAALKQFISNVWGRISALWMNKAKWVNKYKKAINLGAKKAADKKVEVTYYNGTKASSLFSSLKTAMNSISTSSAERVTADKSNNKRFTIKEQISGGIADGHFKDVISGLHTNYEKGQITTTIVSNAITFVEEALKLRTNVELIFKNQEAIIKAGLKIAEALAQRDDDETSKDKAKAELEVHKKKASGLSKIKSVFISALNKAISINFLVCKKAYSYGPSTKEAFKSGSSTMGESTSILEKYGYQS